MKCIIIFLTAFIISFSYSYSQSRDKGTSRNTENKTDVERVTERVAPPIIDRDTRTKPPDPPTRPNINSGSITPPKMRPVDPPSNPVIVHDRPVFTPYLPPPDYYNPGPVEPIYTDPIETIPPINIVIDYKRLGLQQFRNEDYYNALSSFQLALAQDTLQYSIYYNLGVTEIEIGRYDDAVLSLTKFIDNVIENRMGFYHRGLAYFYLGERESALDDFLVADKYKVDEVKVILKKFYNFY